MTRTLLFTLAAVLLTGCGGPAARDVRPDRAAAALKQTLDAWQAGQKPESLAAAAPPVTARDPDWDAGRVLVGYEVVGAGVPEGPNLRVDVKLKLKDKAGKPAAKTVTYLVGTDPAVTVFRMGE